MSNTKTSSNRGARPETGLGKSFEVIIADALKAVPLEPDAEEEIQLSRYAAIGRLDRSITTLEGFALEHAVRAVLAAHGHYKVLPSGIRFPLITEALRLVADEGDPVQLDVATDGTATETYCPDLVAIGPDGEIVLGEVKRGTAHMRPCQVQDLLDRLAAVAMVAESTLGPLIEPLTVTGAFVAVIDASGCGRHDNVHDFESFGAAIGDPDFAPAMRQFRAAFYAAADTIYAAHVEACRRPLSPIAREDTQRFKVPLYAPFRIRTGSVDDAGGPRA